MARDVGGRSPWLYVLLGCGGCATVVVLVLVALGIVTARWANQVKADLEDPDARARKVREILGCERIPEGYHAGVGLTIPWVLEFAMLSDEPPDPNGELAEIGKAGFLYVNAISAGHDEQRFMDFFDGKTDSIEGLRQHDIDIDAEATLRRGSLELETFVASYVAQRGEVRMEDGSSEGLVTVMMFDCEGDDRVRFGLWYTPDPDPEAAAEDLDLTATIADPATIETFLDQFRLCR